MRLKVIGSSSKGNCYILETPTQALILDAGVRFKEIQKTLDFQLAHVRGCIITHEHGDHTKGAKEVMKAGIDTYMSAGTARAINADGHRLYIVEAKKLYTIGDFLIQPFETEHDASEPLGYVVQYKPTGERLLFATDTFFIRYRFPGLHYILVECNYCLEVLDHNVETGTVSEYLRRRLIRSHFSLDNVLEFLRVNELKDLRKVVLIHLSDGNADAGMMQSQVQRVAKRDTEIAVPGKVIPLELYPF